MNGDNKDESDLDLNGAELEEDDNPWGDGEGGERTVATTAPAFDSNVPPPITAPPPGGRAAPSPSKPGAPRAAVTGTAAGLGAAPPRPAAGVTGAGVASAGVARPSTLAFESKPLAPVPAAGSPAKAAGLNTTRIGTGGAPATLGPKPGAAVAASAPSASKASPLASTTGVGGVGGAGVAGAVKPPSAGSSPANPSGALPLPSKKATMMMGAPVPAPEPPAPASGPKPTAPSPSSRTPSAVSKVSRFDNVPSLVSEEDADDENPTMAIPSGVAMLAIDAAAQDSRAAITAIPAPPPPSLANTAFADSPYAAVRPSAGHPPIAPLSEPEETTRAVSREELLRHQDASVVVGAGAEGDDATLAVPSTANNAARAVPLGFAETLGPSIANAESPTVRPLPGQEALAPAGVAGARGPGVFAWGREPDPRAEIDPLVASEIFDPLVSSQPPASFTPNQPIGGPISGQPGPHGMHGMPPPPMPFGTGPTGATGLHGAAPSPALMQAAMQGGPPMQAGGQPSMHQPMPSIQGMANISGQGWPSGNMPAQAPHPGMGYGQPGPQGWMQPPPQGQAPYDPRAQAAMQARGSNGAAAAAQGNAQGSARGNAALAQGGQGKISPQLIALVAVGVVCVAIFIVGLVLFFTTKF